MSISQADTLHGDGAGQGTALLATRGGNSGHALLVLARLVKRPNVEMMALQRPFVLVEFTGDQHTALGDVGFQSARLVGDSGDNRRSLPIRTRISLRANRSWPSARTGPVWLGSQWEILAVVDSDELAHALADRVQRIVPKGFHVWEHNGMIWYSADSSTSRYGGGMSGSYIAENLHNGDTMEQRVARCAEHALDELQDFVDESSAEPSPGEHTVPRANAKVVGTKLHLWFGDAAARVLECEPIDLDPTD